MKGLLKVYKLSAKRHFFPGFLLTAALLLFLPLTASARLSVSSPEGTLDGAQLVVVGEVAERDYQDTKRRVVVRVDEVIKGAYGEERLTLEMDHNRIYGWAGFDFPEPGAKVFLLLRGEEQCGYWLARDLNCVARVDQGRVTSLYNGRKIGINESSWTPEDYARAYDEAYQAWRVQSKYRAVFRIGERWYYANGRCLSMDGAAFIQKERALVPVRYLARAMGVPEENITWCPSTQTVTLMKDGTTVTMGVGENVTYVNGQPRVIETVPVMVEDRVYLPARYLAEALGFEVIWDNARRAVYIGESN